MTSSLIIKSFTSMLKLIYAIIFGLIGSIVGGLIATGSIIASLGIFWLLVFGDDPWPQWTDFFIAGPFQLIVFLCVWVVFIFFGVVTEED